MTSALMLAILASVALVVANHYIPWMWIWERGMPGLAMYAVRLGCLAVPYTLLIFNWGHAHALGDRSVFGNATAWITALWMMVAVDLGTELILYCFDRYIQQRAGLQAAQNEVDSLRAELSDDPADMLED